MIAFTPNFDSKAKSVACGGAASAPSEEGAGAPKGYKGATEGERTRGCCLHQGVGIHKVIQVSLLFSTRLYLLLSHILGVSLLPSRRFNPLYAVPPPSSEGGEGAPALCTEINCFGKEDSNERNPSGVSFVFVQVSLAENEVFRQAESRLKRRLFITYLLTFHECRDIIKSREETVSG